MGVEGNELAEVTCDLDRRGLLDRDSVGAGVGGGASCGT